MHIQETEGKTVPYHAEREANLLGALNQWIHHSVASRCTDFRSSRSAPLTARLGCAAVRPRATGVTGEKLDCSSEIWPKWWCGAFHPLHPERWSKMHAHSGQVAKILSGMKRWPHFGNWEQKQAELSMSKPIMPSQSCNACRLRGPGLSLDARSQWSPHRMAPMGSKITDKKRREFVILRQLWRNQRCCQSVPSCSNGTHPIPMRNPVQEPSYCQDCCSLWVPPS